MPGRRARDWAVREESLPLFEAIQNKYWVDEIYQATVIAWVLRLRLILSDMDRWVVDGRELFLPFAEFPWFKRATVDAILRLERPTAGHLHWPELDVDLEQSERGS